MVKSKWSPRGGSAASRMVTHSERTVFTPHPLIPPHLPFKMYLQLMGNPQLKNYSLPTIFAISYSSHYETCLSIIY